VLGGALAGQARYAEAEPLLLEGYTGMKQRTAKMASPLWWALTAAAERLVQFYDAWEKPEQAAEWRKQLEVVRKIASPKKP
jgi:hypothetical protein